MARRARAVLPGLLHQLMVRGNNDQLVFVDDEDRQTWLDLAAREAANFGVDVHAYVLLPNRLHVLVTPQTATALSAWMQAVGRRYVLSFNRRHQRRGTLWEGRFRGGVLQAHRYALACMAYFDGLAVTEGLVRQPEDWLWSSYQHYTGQRLEKWLRPQDMVWGLGNTPFAREAAYARLVNAGLSRDLLRALWDNANHGWPLGDGAFLRQIAESTGQRTQRGRAGRPRQAPTAAGTLASELSVPNKFQLLIGGFKSISDPN